MTDAPHSPALDTTDRLAWAMYRLDYAEQHPALNNHDKKDSRGPMEFNVYELALENFRKANDDVARCKHVLAHAAILEAGAHDN